MKRAWSKLFIFLAVVLIGSYSPVRAHSDLETVQKIIDAGKSHEELMKNFEYLCDMIGPRLTGSSQFKQAATWTAQRMRDEGLQGVHLEYWNFGRGWRRGIAYGRMVAPYEMQLEFRALAWTPGTQDR